MKNRYSLINASPCRLRGKVNDWHFEHVDRLGYVDDGDDSRKLAFGFPSDMSIMPR